MDERRWEELDAILDEALDLPREERDAFLLRRLPNFQERSRVERLLAAAESGEDNFSRGGALGGDLGKEFSAFLDGEAVPSDTIPGYELIRPLGSGGMGHVWEAEQKEPVRRRVAVKIIRPELDTGRVVSRFESERQTLALMSHPGIAQVLDAGVTDSGRPFFAMELVDGLPLTTFCDEARMGVRDRLRLFVEVCEAVQHAHQKGVIHRDLKPSNVQVTRIDGRPAPKVIDFGIARLAETPLSPETLLTEAGQVIGTPEYMSPEQAGSNPADVDTRSDVYSLGVLLYELLTGSLPHRRTSSTPASMADLFAEIRIKEALLPSKRITSLGDDAARAAVLRNTDTWGLARKLRRDLDWITAKALEKDRTRRYASVGELAEEVRRYLRDEPVEAGPPGAMYRLRKFVRRNSGLLAASAAILLALIAGLVGTMFGLVRAQQETEHARTQAAIAEAVNDFLNEDLLAAVSPEAQGRDVTMLQVLEAATERLEGRFHDQPLVEASVRGTIGQTYFTLGRLDEASVQLEKALSLRQQVLGEDATEALEVMHLLGELRFYQGDGPGAREYIQHVLEGRERTLGPMDPLTISALSDLGAVSQHSGDLEEAERCYREAHQRAQEVMDPDDPNALAVVHNLGALLYDLAQYEEAAEYLTQSYEGSKRTLGEEHPETLTTRSLLGSVYREWGRLDEAEPIYFEVYEARKRVLGEEHPSTLMSASNLGVLMETLGRYAEAVEIHKDVLRAKRRTLGSEHDATILSLGNLGLALVKSGRPEEAEIYLEEAVSACRRTLGNEHSLCGSSLRKLGQCWTELDRFEEAEEALLEAHAIAVDNFEQDHPSVQKAREALAKLYERWGRTEDSEIWGQHSPADQ